MIMASSPVTSQSKDSHSEMYLTPRFVGELCKEYCERMQLVADLLLLNAGTTTPSPGPHRYSVLQPVSGTVESCSKLRDAIIANTKILAISIKEFGQKMNSLSLSNVQKLAEKITGQVIDLTEGAACAAYYSALTDVQCTPAKPGIIDRYKFERARQELYMSYKKLKPDYGHPMSSELVLNISKSFAESLALLAHTCKQTSENKHVNPTDRAQFAACCQSIQGATAAFLSALKAFASSRTEENKKRCLLFGKPLLCTVDSIVEFSSSPHFSGRPATLTDKGQESQIHILGGAMALISACIQLLNTAKSILCESPPLARDKEQSPSRWQKLTNCIKAVGDCCVLLSTSVTEHTPLSSRRPSILY